MTDIFGLNSLGTKQRTNIKTIQFKEIFWVNVFGSNEVKSWMLIKKS